MSALPCLNPSCKSHGQPHPNCRCYGGMAGGGEASAFCSENREHEPFCQYFDDGGSVLSPEGFTPDNAQPEMNPEHFTPDSSMSPEDFTPDSSNPYATTGQRVLGDVEAAGRGLLGPLPALAETKVFGMDPKDIAGREATEGIPGEHAAIQGAAILGSAFYGVGEAWAASKIAGALVPKAIPILGKLGSAAVKAGIEGGLYQTSDEIGKALMGQNGGDPQAAFASAMANTKMTALMGLGAGAFFHGVGATTSGLLQKTKLGPALNDFLAGVGSAAEDAKSPDELPNLIAPEGVNPKTFEKGIKFYNEGVGNLAARGARGAVEASMGEAVRRGHGLPVAGTAIILADRFLGPLIQNIAKKPLTAAAKKYAIPALLKTLGAGAPEAAEGAIDYATNISRGVKHISSQVERIFNAGAQQTYESQASEEEREQLRNYIEQGGMDKAIQDEAQPAQAYAAGGSVEPQGADTPMATVFPEQNAMLSATKARVSGYLNSIRPLSNQPKLPFDEEPSNTEKKRSYNKALNIAIKPLSILSHIKDGTLDVEQVKHAQALYPEVMDHLRGKLTERITKAQTENKKPSYQARLGMSLFLGAPLDSTMTPQGIMAAQSVFAKKQMAQQPQMAPKQKKSKSSLSQLADSRQTPDQARIERGQKG